MARMTLLGGLSMVVLIATTYHGGAAGADNDELYCTASKLNWLSRVSIIDLLLTQGYKEVHAIEITDGNCYEVYAIDGQGENVVLRLDPMDGHVVTEEN